jgi:anaerobic magnesium-protoporphyrin IX monomethyl ester cyclase
VTVDILLSHGYFLADDPRERQVMRPYPPLGLLYLSAYLKSQGAAPKVFDSTFASFPDFEQVVRQSRPPVVGLYANLMTRATVVRQMQVCRAAGAVVIVGGPEPASYVEEYLSHGADIVVIGEGETTLAELVAARDLRDISLLADISGIAFRDAEGRVVHTRPRAMLPDLDALPFPDREAIDMAHYVDVWRRYHGRGSVSLITARGCAYRCNWCSHGVYGFSHRRRSPANVADEVEMIRDRYSPDMLWYADDVFTVKPSWLRAYAAELERRGARLPFETITREDRLDEDTVRTLASMGCFRIWVGSESGSQRILDVMQRRTDSRRVPQMVRLLQQQGIEAGIFMMLGYEGEEWSDIDESVRMLKRAPPDLFLTTTAYPIKGTGYYERVADRAILPPSWAEASDRDISVAGRHSTRFYGFAHRWMANELGWYREWRSPRPRYRRLLVSLAKAKASRLGMYAFRHQTEGG